MSRYFPTVEYARMDGSTTPTSRSALVERFNRITDPLRILLLTTRSSGLGLNLIGADTVIFMEHDWYKRYYMFCTRCIMCTFVYIFSRIMYTFRNPAVDRQAMDRAHRIGQDKPVTVYRVIGMYNIHLRTHIKYTCICTCMTNFL